MSCLRVSSDSPPLDEKGADNHEVSPRAIELDCLWIARVADDHMLPPCVIGLVVSG